MERKRKDGGMKERESNKTEMGSPRPTHVLRQSLSKDRPPGGRKVNVEECVFFFTICLMIFN